jgi:hypothetical protein
LLILITIIYFFSLAKMPSIVFKCKKIIFSNSVSQIGV